MKESDNEIAMKLSVDHAEWYIKSIRPHLIESMYHGFKHGFEWAKEQENKKREK